MSKRKPIVQTSALDAYYVGDDSDGAYYQVAKGWYVTVWVAGAWKGDIATDKGPWKTEEEALIGVEAKRSNGALRTVFRIEKADE